MFFPFFVADPVSGAQYRLNDTRLSELSLSPRFDEWMPGRVMSENPDPIWRESFEKAPAETISAVTSGLESLIVACPDLTPPDVMELPESRAKFHLTALIRLWQKMGDALPDGLGVVRHVLTLPEGRFIGAIPVVAGSLDPYAPAVFKALYERLSKEFGTVEAKVKPRLALPNGRLHALQGGLTAADILAGPRDESLAFFGLRDPAACADFAAARARKLIDTGCPAHEIAVMTAQDPRQLARAFARQGIALSGLPSEVAERDVVGETLLHLLLAKRTPTPAMVLAALALSPLMPWETQTGRALAEAVMNGDFRGRILERTPQYKALWEDIRASASSLAQLRFLMNRICDQMRDGEALRVHLNLPQGDGTPNWESLLQNLPRTALSVPEPVRNLEGVSLWMAHESPWRPCRHLIVTDFTEGFYPAKPQANPAFLDSEIATIQQTCGLNMRGRAENLSRSLSLFDEQLQAASESVTFLIPWRNLAGQRLAPSAGLSLLARAIKGHGDPIDLVTDIASLTPQDWPVDAYLPQQDAINVHVPDSLNFAGRDLLEIRKTEDGEIKPQSPSRMETLIVSPLAWLLGEIGAEDMSWTAETLDVLLRGNIAHDVFENVFKAEQKPPEGEELQDAVSEAYDQAIGRLANFLRNPAWEMERKGLEREISDAARLWGDYLTTLGATILGNETWLNGVVHGVALHGKADTILQLPDDSLLVVDHKKSGTKGRRVRMEKGWDLQAGLYRDMIANPTRHEGDKMEPLLHRKVAIAYHLMNDGGFLTSGADLPPGTPARAMGDRIDENAVSCLTEILGEVRNGRIPINSKADEAAYKKDRGYTPYALTDGSPLVRVFLRDPKEE